MQVLQRGHAGTRARGRVYMLIFKMWWAPCPLWVFTGENWFPCRTLNPFLLPLACPSLQRDGSPPLLILSGYHRDEGEKCPGCRFRFEFSCCRNAKGAKHWQGRVRHEERGGLPLSDIWRITNGKRGRKTGLDLEKKQWRGRKEEQEKWMRGGEEWSVLLSARRTKGLTLCDKCRFI